MGKRNRTHNTNYRKLWQSSDDRDVLGKRNSYWEQATATDPSGAMVDSSHPVPDYRSIWQQPQAEPMGAASGITMGGCLDPSVTFDRADFGKDTPQKSDQGKGKLVIPPDGGCF